MPLVSEINYLTVFLVLPAQSGALALSYCVGNSSLCICVIFALILVYGIKVFVLYNVVVWRLKFHIVITLFLRHLAPC